GRQRRVVPPASRVARTGPSGENARVRTLPAWPTSVQRSRPVAGSHSLTVPSSLPEAIDFPSGEKATAQIAPAFPPSLRRIDGLAGAATSQTITVPSWLPEARVRPSGAKATGMTSAVCPTSRLASAPPAATSQSITFWSKEADARIRPLREKAREETLPACENLGGPNRFRFAASHRQIAPLLWPVARIASTGEKATADGSASWARSSRGRPGSTSHTPARAAARD